MSNLWTGRKQCSVIKYPSGRYGLVGSIPQELTVEKTNSIQQTFSASKVWNTMSELQSDVEQTGHTLDFESQQNIVLT